MVTSIKYTEVFRDENMTKFNAFNKKIIKLASVTIILMGLFPPWLYTVSASGGIYNEKPASYALIFNPPAPKVDTPIHGVKLDFQKLLLQWFLVLLASAVLLVIKGNNNE